MRINDYGYWEDAVIISQINDLTAVLPETKKAIATNNPNVDIPQVVDEVEILAKNLDKSKCRNFRREHTLKEVYEGIEDGFIIGYNKSQERHPFSEEDVRFMLSEAFKASQECYQITSYEIIQLCKEQRPKKVYYA